MKPKASIHCRVRFGSAGRRKVLRQAGVGQDEPRARTARVAQLMALAIRLEELIAAGHVPSYAGLARLVGVSRARLTQIANLTLLAPDIQEAILFFPPVVKGREPITERHLRPLVAEPDWQRQRAQWKRLTARRGRSKRATKVFSSSIEKSPQGAELLLVGQPHNRA